MDDIIGPIKTYFAKRDPSTIENATFKLHVRVTFALMLACMALVSCCSIMMMMILMVMMVMMVMMMTLIMHDDDDDQVGAGMFGDPIDCMADGVPGGAMNLFCWIHSTFSVSSR